MATYSYYRSLGSHSRFRHSTLIVRLFLAGDGFRNYYVCLPDVPNDVDSFATHYYKVMGEPSLGNKSCRSFLLVKI